MAEAQVAPLNFNPAELIKRVEDTEKRLQTKDAEIQVYKMLMSQMEEELAQAKKYKAIQEKQTQDVDSMKVESEKTLTKAKSLIFERTKIIKNQELQIEAFVQQIDSLKEVVRITKDLLEIRNLEIKQLENKIAAIEGKMKAEQERFDLMHKKLEQMIRHNGELKREYETQLCLFSALRERYNERELAKDVVDDLKEELVDAKTKRDQAVVDNENLENVAAENNVENEKLSIDQDKAKQTDNTKSDVDNTKNNIEKTSDKKEEDLEPDTNNSALVDAKNRLDNILSVLENTFGIDNMTPNSDDNKKEAGGLEKNNARTSREQTVTGTVKPAIEVDKRVHQNTDQAKTDNLVPAQPEAGRNPEQAVTGNLVIRQPAASRNADQAVTGNLGTAKPEQAKPGNVITAKPEAGKISEQAKPRNVITAKPEAGKNSEQAKPGNVVTDQAGTENVVTPQPEPSSTLDNIISAIKTTVGLGSNPLPENKEDDKNVSTQSKK